MPCLNGVRAARPCVHCLALKLKHNDGTMSQIEMIKVDLMISGDLRYVYYCTSYSLQCLRYKAIRSEGTIHSLGRFDF